MGGSAQARKDLEACCDEKATQVLRQAPSNWTLEHDEELAKFTKAAKLQKENASESAVDPDGGQASQYVQSLRASSVSLMDQWIDLASPREAVNIAVFTACSLLCVHF